MTLNNTNGFPVRITGVQQNGPVVVGPGRVRDPGTSGVSVPTNNLLSVTVVPGSGPSVTVQVS